MFSFPSRGPEQCGGLHSGLGSTNICSSRGPSAAFLCPSGARAVINLLLFTLHSIFVSGLCHWDLRSQHRTWGNLWIFTQAGERGEGGSYLSRDVAFLNSSFPSPFLCPLPTLFFHVLYSDLWTRHLQPCLLTTLLICLFSSVLSHSSQPVFLLPQNI